MMTAGDHTKVCSTKAWQQVHTDFELQNHKIQENEKIAFSDINGPELGFYKQKSIFCQTSKIRPLQDVPGITSFVARST